MNTYRHIFFDLDRTLWDYETNSRETLLHLLEKYRLSGKISPELFLQAFEQHNEQLWKLYSRGQVTKNILRVERMRRTLEGFGLHDETLVNQFSDEFISHLPTRTGLFPDAREVLQYLHAHYHLYILSNGFKETQLAKIEQSGLSPFFEKVFTSDELKTAKPSAEFFHHALTSVHARKQESLMVGDDPEADILGASRAGIDQVFFNPFRMPHEMKPTYEIQALRELMNIL